MRLFSAVAPYVQAQKLGVMLWSSADLHLGSDQLSRPDLFVVPSLPPDRSWAAPYSGTRSSIAS